jgi:hypothetical protein
MTMKDPAGEVARTFAEGIDHYFTLIDVMRRINPKSMGAALVATRMLAHTYERLTRDGIGNDDGKGLIEAFAAQADGFAAVVYEGSGVGPKVRAATLADDLQRPDAAFTEEAREKARVAAQEALTKILGSRGGAL